MSIVWALGLFSLFAGFGGGVLVFVGLSELFDVAGKSRFPATVVATIAIVVGGIASVSHLSRPDRVLNALGNLSSASSVSLEFAMVGACLVLGIAYLVLGARGLDMPRKVVGVLALVAGVALAFLTGQSFGMAARPQWNSILLPLSFLGTSLSAGGFLFLLVEAIRSRDAGSRAAVALWALVGAVLGAVSSAAYVAFIGLEAAGASPLALWGGVIACGVAGALALGILGRLKARGAALPGIAAAGLATALIGGLSLRYLMWVAGSGSFTLLGATATQALL